jgi:hypothetical protein
LLLRVGPSGIAGRRTGNVYPRCCTRCVRVCVTRSATQHVRTATFPLHQNPHHLDDRDVRHTHTPHSFFLFLARVPAKNRARREKKIEVLGKFFPQRHPPMQFAKVSARGEVTKKKKRREHVSPKLTRSCQRCHHPESRRHSRSLSGHSRSLAPCVYPSARCSLVCVCVCVKSEK